MTAPILDVHTHPLLPSFVEAMSNAEGASAKAGESMGITLPPWSMESHLEMMERHGLGVSMFSMQLPGALAGAQARATARRLNDDLAALVAQQPSRFGALAVIPMDDMDAALEETAYALNVLKLDGLGVVTHHAGRYLGDKAYDPWFEELDRRGATVFVHPTEPPGFKPEETSFNVSVLEFMFDSTRMIANMALSGAKARFANVRMISPHGGGAVPYLAHRIGTAGIMPWAYKGGLKQSTDEIEAAIKTFYFDLTAATSPAQLDAILRLVPASQLLSGTDFPLMPEATIEPAAKAFEAYDGLSESDRDAIRWRNAESLFPAFKRT